MGINIPVLYKYIISEDGEIAKAKNGRKLSIILNKDGYRVVKLPHENGVYKNVLLHRLVANKFIANPENLETVNHIDGDKLNNSIENLEWMSRGDNCRHYTRTTKRWIIEAKNKLHIDAYFNGLTRKNGRSYISFDCKDCNECSVTRLDSTRIEKGICYKCSRKKGIK